MRKLLRFFKNIWVYRRELWGDRHWDEAFLVAFVERKLRLMHAELSDPNKSMAIHTKKELRRLKIAAEYARRITGDHYYSDTFWRQSSPETRWKDVLILETRDWNGLWDTIKKYGRTWWD
jgi:hypothetical protein